MVSFWIDLGGMEWGHGLTVNLSWAWSEFFSLGLFPVGVWGGGESLVQGPYFVGCLRALFSPGYLGKVFHLYSHCELGSYKHLFNRYIKHKMQYHR